MADSLLTSLLGTLDNRSIGAVASSLGESEHSVTRGLQTTLTGVLASIASKCEDSSFCRKIFDLCRGEAGDISWSQMAGGVSDPNSSLITSGKRMLGSIFGGAESSVATAVSAESGLRPSSTSWIMAMAAPMVMNFLGRRIRDDGMTTGGFASLLQREIPAIRAALPASLANLFWPRGAAATPTGPVVTQAATAQKSHSIWPAALAILALALGLGWLFNRSHTPSVPEHTAQVPVKPAPMGEASRYRTESEVPKQANVPNEINVQFDSNSSKMGKDSMDQVDGMTATVKSDPAYNMKVAGYTDNSGDADRNMELSKRRADSVVAVLIGKGISRDRISVEGHGQDNPVADNSTPEGRAENRRVTISVVPR